MGELGEFLGWVTGALFAASLATYFAKRINKRWILALPKESAVRRTVQPVVKLTVKNHRWFGIAAAAAMAVHLLAQILWEFPSVTGLLAAALLLTAALLGIAMAWGHRGKLLGLHRAAAFAAFAVTALHLIVKR